MITLLAATMIVQMQVGEMRTTIRLEGDEFRHESSQAPVFAAKIKNEDAARIMRLAERLPVVIRLPASCSRDWIEVQLKDARTRKTCIAHKTQFQPAYARFAEELRWLRILYK